MGVWILDWTITLPETNLKIAAPWKRRFLLETIIFRGENVSFTWRIIPFSKWLITMVIMVGKSRKDRVVGPLPNSLNGL